MRDNIQRGLYLAEFEKGREAYQSDLIINLDVHSDVFNEGYKDAWYEANSLPSWMDGDGVRVDSNWEEHKERLFQDSRPKTIVCSICGINTEAYTSRDGRLICWACNAVFAPVKCKAGFSYAQ